MAKNTLTAAIIAFCGGVLVGYYLVTPIQHVAGQKSAGTAAEGAKRGLSVESSVDRSGAGIRERRYLADQMSARRGTDTSPAGVRSDPGRTTEKASVPLNMSGSPRPLLPGPAPRLQEEYAEVLRELGLQEADVRDRIATFTIRQPTADDEGGTYPFRRSSGPSAEELAAELEAVLLEIGVPPSDVPPIVERFIDNDLRSDAAEEKHLEAELERVVQELRIPVTPPPEE